MKIALLHSNIISLPWYKQGASIEIWVYEVSRRLASAYDVVVFAARGTHQQKDAYHESVHYKRIAKTFGDQWFSALSSIIDLTTRFTGLKDLRRVILYRNAKRPLFASRWINYAYILKVAKEIRKEKCDVVHIHNYSQFVPIIRAFNPQVKIFLHMDCEWLTQLERSLILPRLKAADIIVGCSDYITNKIRHAFPLYAQRCHTLYNGVNIDHFYGENRISSKKKTILFVGRITPEKGIHVLLDAYELVKRVYPGVQLNIVGPLQSQTTIEFIVMLSNDPKVSALEAYYNRSYASYLQGRSSKADGSISFTGFIPYGNIIRHYQGADVLVNPSFSESFGRSLIEAMACKVPVVATKVGGMPEIVEDGETGILVDSGDATALADALLCLLQDADLRDSMGKAGRQRVLELFSWEPIVEQLKSLYKKYL